MKFNIAAIALLTFAFGPLCSSLTAMAGESGEAIPKESSSKSQQGTRPNVLFIFTDDHASHSISAYGSKINKTPNIDRIAKQGMLFNRCYVTNSICGPMRATILTGKYSHLNGFLVNGNKFDGNQQTFPKLLQKAGYQTAIVGKWHLGEHMAPTGFDYSEVLIGQGPYYNPPMIKNGVKTSHTGYTTDIITDLALDWLNEKRDSSKPFMLMLQHKAPHRNWQPGPKHLNMFDGETIPEPATLFDDHSGRGTPSKTQDMSIEKTMTDFDLKLTPPRNLTKAQLKTWNAAYNPKNEAFRKANLKGKDLVRWKYQRYIKDYLRCIASVDENIGRVLKNLDDSGLAKNTVVIYCSDQGFYLGDHGWFDKRWMYEESLKTPFVCRWPGVTKPGSISNDIVSPIDFAETFLEIAGAKIPDDMQGKSLVPILSGKSPSQWRQSFYYHYYEFPGWHDVRRHYGVTDGRHKLIHFYEKDLNEWELFDLKKDPNEMKSVYGQANYADVQSKLVKELDRLRKELKVPVEDPRASLGGGKDGANSVVIRNRSSRPYSGKPIPIPGLVEAENFNRGKAGIAYSDVDPENQGAKYREKTSVDIEKRKDASNGFGIGWTKKGEWLLYTVQVAKTGTYDLSMPVASNKKGGTLHLEINGKNISGPIAIPDTGGWDKLMEVEVSGVKLTKGVQIIKVVMDSVGESGSTGDIDYFKFELSK